MALYSTVQSESQSKNTGKFTRTSITEVTWQLLVMLIWKQEKKNRKQQYCFPGSSLFQFFKLNFENWSYWRKRKKEKAKHQGTLDFYLKSPKNWLMYHTLMRKQSTYYNSNLEKLILFHMMLPISNAWFRTWRSGSTIHDFIFFLLLPISTVLTIFGNSN